MDQKEKIQKILKESKAKEADQIWSRLSAKKQESNGGGDGEGVKNIASYKKAVTTGRKVCDLEQAWEFKGRREGPDASVGVLKYIPGSCEQAL